METHIVCRHKHGRIETDRATGGDVFIPARVVCVDCLRLHLLTRPGNATLPAEVVDYVMEVAARLSRG
jgi:hypothetical protein